MRRALVAVTLLLGCAPLTAAPAHAAVEDQIVVSAFDELRAAVTAASTDDAAPHTIVLDADITVLFGPPARYAGALPLTLLGGGHVVRSAGEGGFRFFVSNTTAPVAIRDLTVTDFTGPGQGAAVYSRGPLTLARTVFRRNVSHDDRGGGAVHGLGRVTIRRSIFTANAGSVEFGSSSAGGAVSAGNDLFVEHSVFERNTANSGGGALFSNVGQLTVRHSRFRANTIPDDGFGGAIDSFAEVRISDSAFLENSASFGGAVSMEGSIVRSTFEHNEGGSGGAVYAGDLDVRDSSFVANEAGEGGAIRGGRVVVTNTTFADNVATGRGGAFATDAGVLALNYVTMVRNSAPRGAQLAMAHNPVRLNHTVLAAPRGGGTNCGDAEGGRSDFSFHGDPSCLQSGGAGNRSGPGPLFQDLRRSLRGTLIAEPRAGVTIVDAIPADQCGNVTLDQRGVHRPQGPACDMGAVERG